MMPKKSRPNAKLQCRRKHSKPGKRQTYKMVNQIQVVEYNMELHYNPKELKFSKIQNGYSYHEDVIDHFDVFSANEDDSSIDYCELSDASSDEEVIDSKRNHEFFVNQRKSIAHIYQSTFKCAPEDEWFGCDGVVSKIIVTLNLNQSSRNLIIKTLRDYNECIKNGEIYSGTRKKWVWKDKDILINENSHEFQIIGNAMESGHGIRATTNMVNLFR